MFEGRDLAHSFVLMFTSQLNNYIDRNASTGKLLQHISEYIVVCARSRPKMLSKNPTEKFVWFHDHCLLLTMP